MLPQDQTEDLVERLINRYRGLCYVADAIQSQLAQLYRKHGLNGAVVAEVEKEHRRVQTLKLTIRAELSSGYGVHL